MSNKYQIVLAIVMMISVTSCSSSDDDSSGEAINDTAANETSQPVEEALTPVPITAPAGLNGLWLGPCIADDSDVTNPEFEITELLVEDDVFTANSEFFSDDACTQATSPSSAIFSVMYTGTTETSLGIANNIDLTLESVTFGDTEFAGLPEIADTFLNIALVQGDTLFFGDFLTEFENDISVRPTTIDQSVVFMRQ